MRPLAEPEPRRAEDHGLLPLCLYRENRPDLENVSKRHRVPYDANTGRSRIGGGTLGMPYWVQECRLSFGFTSW